MQLPADGHVHSQFSWDAYKVGDMQATCARAVELGLPAVVFTEHVDFTPFRAGFLAPDYPELVDEKGVLRAPALDVEGYFECVQRCRVAFPQLTILAGMEVGQPHRHVEQVDALLAAGSFDRVLGSLHCLLDGPAGLVDSSAAHSGTGRDTGWGAEERGEQFAEPWELYPHYEADEVFRAYLAEIPRMVAGSAVFTSFAHIDYPVRSWPEEAASFDPLDFEGELRGALRALAQAERALEINTRRLLEAVIVRWWRQEGGRLVTFGSDAHLPDLVGAGLAHAADLAAAEGFGPDRLPGAPWLFRASKLPTLARSATARASA